MCAKAYDEINYCLRCGTQLEIGRHFGGKRPACPACSWVYFADPKVAVAAVIEEDHKILLVRRRNNPQRGLWTLPAGFVDAEEDPVIAIERECLEETGLKTRVTGLKDVVFGKEHERGANIIIVYFVEVLAGDLTPGDDVDRVEFYSYQDLPPLAFQTTHGIIYQLSHLKT